MLGSKGWIVTDIQPVIVLSRVMDRKWGSIKYAPFIQSSRYPPKLGSGKW